MKILFVCKHNRFRSKVACVIARKLDSRNEYKSAGISLDLMRPYICGNVKQELARRGYEIKDEKAREINGYDLKWADKIIIVADNISSDIFKRKTKVKIETWKISDADEQEFENIRKIVENIEERVKKLRS